MIAICDAECICFHKAKDKLNHIAAKKNSNENFAQLDSGRLPVWGKLFNWILGKFRRIFQCNTEKFMFGRCESLIEFRMDRKIYRAAPLATSGADWWIAGKMCRGAEVPSPPPQRIEAGISVDMSLLNWMWQLMPAIQSWHMTAAKPFQLQSRWTETVSGPDSPQNKQMELSNNLRRKPKEFFFQISVERFSMLLTGLINWLRLFGLWSLPRAATQSKVSCCSKMNSTRLSPDKYLWDHSRQCRLPLSTINLIQSSVVTAENSGF